MFKCTHRSERCSGKLPSSVPKSRRISTETSLLQKSSFCLGYKLMRDIEQLSITPRHDGLSNKTTKNQRGKKKKRVELSLKYPCLSSGCSSSLSPLALPQYPLSDGWTDGCYSSCSAALARLLPSNCICESGAGGFAHNQHRVKAEEEEQGREWVSGVEWEIVREGWERREEVDEGRRWGALTSGGQCVWMRLPLISTRQQYSMRFYFFINISNQSGTRATNSQTRAGHLVFFGRRILCSPNTPHRVKKFENSCLRVSARLSVTLFNATQ